MQNISPFLPVRSKRMCRTGLMRMHCTCFYVTDRWGLNFAFYLRCSHVSQQCMNLRRDIIKNNNKNKEIHQLHYKMEVLCFQCGGQLIEDKIILTITLNILNYTISNVEAHLSFVVLFMLHFIF